MEDTTAADRTTVVNDSNSVRGDAPITPLAVGTTLLDRYAIIETLSRENGINLYRVAEARLCPQCGVENEGNLSHCGYCGNELPRPRTFLLAERRAPTGETLIPTSFRINGLTYAFARDVERQKSAPQAPLQFDAGFGTDPGLVRGGRGEPNEDSVLVMQLSAQHNSASPTLGVFLIADGVGGAEAGEIASEMTARVVAHELLSQLLAQNVALDDVFLRAILIAAVGSANAQVLEYAHTHHLSLGSTLTLALILDNRGYFANVGDSRAYLYRDGVLTQITRDHSYVAQLIAKGEITAEEARVHPRRNLISRSLGDETGFAPDIFPQEGNGAELRAGDQILLCSDGLWEMVFDDELAQILEQASDAQDACAQLTAFANAAGGADNISVVVVRVSQ